MTDAELREVLRPILRALQAFHGDAGWDLYWRGAPELTMARKVFGDDPAAIWSES